MQARVVQFRSARATSALVVALSCGGLACERGAPPGAEVHAEPVLRLGAPFEEEHPTPNPGADARVGTAEDRLPFAPTGEKLASIAWRTWVYTDVGPERTRLGYLRAGAVVDARGPLLKNSGCEAGWYRINPRGFVCLGKGATTDLNHPIVRESSVRARRGSGFPYVYGMSESRPPERYFRLPTLAQMNEVEAERVADRGLAWLLRARESGLDERLQLAKMPPDFLPVGASLEKPYGTKMPLRRQVHSGRASSESGFAFSQFFEWEGRAFGLTTEMDLLPLDRVKLHKESALAGVVIAEGAVPEGKPLDVAFLVKGATTLWRKNEEGRFVPESEQRDKRGFLLTGAREPGGFLETSEGFWIVEETVRRVRPREAFPSVATGSRKWIDISIREQSLVAYEGKRPVYATLVSTGRGELGDPERDHATIRGTFMIYEKSVSSTMDGDEDRADSYELGDVPFVQYFHKGFALHGAYWHDEFGKARSHGCVNLAARDSAWLFEWTDPQVPPGWHAVLNKERGTVVVVRP